MTHESTIEKSKLYLNTLSNETLEFMQKILERSGLGQSTYLPDALLKDPPNPCMEEARKEAEQSMFGAVDEVLAKTGVESKEIGILVVNCTIFSAVPSLSSMIVNRYKLGDGVLSYNLSGMGCSASLSAIGLAKQLLKVHRNTYALVVSTENITENCYKGNDRSMILINCLFRVGGAAILLSNRPSDRCSSKYELIHTVHTHTASSDRSYNCIFKDEDCQGYKGVIITKDLITVAIKAIETNITALGKLVLPVSEQLLFITNYLIRYLHVAKIKPYVPKFNHQFDHFFPHVGGKPVLDELQKSLEFDENQMEASRMTLYRFGNISSSSIWYELAYAEAKGRIKKGDRMWQIAFGSGFKCNSAIWRAIRTVEFEKGNPWSDEIDEFPVDVSQLGIMPFHFELSKKT